MSPEDKIEAIRKIAEKEYCRVYSHWLNTGEIKEVER